MSYDCKILADSISPDLIRLTTYEVTFPRFILAEVNTHRVKSRNSASSRAIPPEKIILRVKENPFVPEFNKRVQGMGVGVAFTERDAELANAIWLSARDSMVNHANLLLILDADKSRVNRLLEPFMWHTAIITATEWSNFFALRTDEGAQPEFRQIASMMQEMYRDNQPRGLDYGQWHLPLLDVAERAGANIGGDAAYWKKVSVGRCARVSYLTHDGKHDPQADIDLHDRLMTNGHLSPFEHVARPINPILRREAGEYEDSDGEWWSGNFRGWHQYRKDIPFEHDFAQAQEAATC